MAKARKILAHAQSVETIRTVTRSMEMVSTVRFKRAHDRIVSARPFVQRLAALVGDVVDRCPPAQLDHPLLKAPEGVDCDILLVLTSNRGLCAAYNHAVVRIAAERATQLRDAGYEVRLHVAGRRGIRRLKAMGFEIEREYTEFDDLPDYHDVVPLADEMAGELLDGRISGVEIAYMQFVSSGRQRAAIAQTLPLSTLTPPERFLPHGGEPLAYEFLPSVADVLEELLPTALRLRVYQCFVDAAASEQISRMRAMRAATDNAEEMIRRLTIDYNRARQGQITTELAEIMGGRMGLK